jgi:anti-sigma factor RsiW
MSEAELECDRLLLLQADFDGELSAAEAADLNKHRATCSVCAQAVESLRQARSLVKTAKPYEAPASLQRALAAKLSAAASSERVVEFRQHRKARGWMITSAGLAAAASILVVLIWLTRGQSETGDLIVDNHLRAMQVSAHLVDVVASDHHTVKPWFSGQLNYAPPVKDLEGFGYVLKGGRVDVIDGEPVGVVVYQVGKHIVDVTVQPKTTTSVSASSVRRGFNVREWQDQGMTLWAVSDLNAQELDAFVSHWQK